jgi:hypothetical protein
LKLPIFSIHFGTGGSTESLLGKMVLIPSRESAHLPHELRLSHELPKILLNVHERRPSFPIGTEAAAPARCFLVLPVATAKAGHSQW